jgi:hypothetical protein
MRGNAQRKPAPRVVIQQTRDSGGSTFALAPETQRDLIERFGDKLQLSDRIFVGRWNEDPTRLHGRLSKQLLILLTGIDDDDLLAEMGEIEFFRFH